MYCMMPDLDGFETTTLIRDPEGPVQDKNIPIFACTAYVTQENRNRCFSSGMNDFLEKSVTIALLATTLVNW